MIKKINLFIPTTFLLPAFVFMLLTSCSTKKEDKNFDSFYEANKNKEHVISVSVPVSVVKMVFMGNDIVKEVLNHVDEVKFITYEGKRDSVVHFMSELKVCMPETVYKDLIGMKTGGDDMDVKVREEGAKVKEGVLISSDSISFFAVDLKGELDIEKVKKLAESVDLQKLKDLAKGAGL